MASKSYGDTPEAIEKLADEYGIDKTSFIKFWKMRFPDHGVMYMRTWAQRLHLYEAQTQADRETMHALRECGLI